MGTNIARWSKLNVSPLANVINCKQPSSKSIVSRVFWIFS